MSGLAIKTNSHSLRLTWPEHHLFCTLDRFQDRGGVSKAELSAYLDGDTPRLLTQGSLTLTSLQGRGSFARRLTELHPDAPWDTVIENIAVHGLQFRRRGEPVMVLEPTDTICVPFDVNPLIYKNHQTLLYAPGGSLKSYLALLIALLACNGQRCAGLAAVRSGVLYLDWELNAETVGGRLKAMQTGHPELSARPYYRRCEVPFHQEAHQIAAHVAERDVRLLIIDSAAMACGGDLASPDSAIALQRALRQIGCSSLVLAHVAKNFQDGQEKSAYGTVFFRELARNVWDATRGEDDAACRVVLQQKKNNFGPIHAPLGFAFTFDAQSVRVTACDPAEEPALEAKLPLAARIRNLLEDGLPRTAETIADVLEVKLATAKVTLSREKGRKWQMLGGPGQEGTTYTVLVPKMKVNMQS